MPTKKQRMLLKREHKEKERLTYYSWTNRKRFVLVVAGVLILGGIFSLGWFLGARSQLPVTEVVSGVPLNSYLPEVNRISVEDLKAKLDADSNIVIIDSQDVTNYNQSHIVGAISIPLGTMTGPYSDLNGYDEIITYCN